MILKRIASKGNKKARNCLKCNSRLLNLKGDRGKEPRTCYELSVNQYELQKKKETA